nr:ferredoxin [Cochlodiniinecator piscidefendens]
MNYSDALAQVQAVGLDIVAALNPGADTPAPKGCKTILMLGPNEPEFWRLFSTSPEYTDGQPDPMDRWSKRIIAPLADKLGGSPQFPSDGPSYPAFFQWALKSGRAWASPVNLMVHDSAGLFVSFRGAITLPTRLSLPKGGPSPCNACAAPCTTECPVDALTPTSYDVPRCKAFLRRPEGYECLTRGCRARRICPISQTYPRLPQQSEFHMKAFLDS